MATFSPQTILARRAAALKAISFGDKPASTKTLGAKFEGLGLKGNSPMLC